MLNRRAFLQSAAALGAGAAVTASSGWRGMAAETMRLYWWGTPDRTERTLGVARLFEAANPEVKINGEVGGNDYWQKLTTMMAGGNAPDIFQLEPSRYADYVRRGTVLPLDAFLGKTIRTDKLAPGVLDLGTVDGKVCGMPTGLNAFALLYDAKLFENAGIAPPNEKTTWDDFARIAVDLTKAIGRRNAWGVTNCARYSNAMQAFVEQRGKKLFTTEGGLGFDIKDATDWYAYWDSLAKAGGCIPADMQALDNLTVDTSPMIKGNCAMTITFSNLLPAYQAVIKSPLAITTLPVSTPDGPSGLFYRPGLYWAIATNAANPEMAAKFIDVFVNDAEAGKLLGAERGVPVNVDIKAAITPQVEPVPRATIEYITAIAGRVGPYPPPVPVGTAEFDQRVFKPVADKLAFGQLTPAQAAEELIVGGKAIFKR